MSPAPKQVGDGLEPAAHFQRLARLLALEAEAEAARVVERTRRLSAADAERAGLAVVGLVADDQDAGLGGRYLVKFVKRSRAQLPWSRLDAGSPVVLSSPSGQSPPYRGVISHRDRETLWVAFASPPDDLDEHNDWRLDLAHDEIARLRQQTAMRRAEAARGNSLARLRDVLLGSKAAEFEPLKKPLADTPGVNLAQRAAIELALSARDVALIHGPPGTGKTTTVVELIRQAVARGAKVLACAPSNLAVDNVFERLLAAGVEAVRLGHPARVLPELRAHTLDVLVDEHHDVRVARKLVKDAWALFRKAGRYTRAKPAPGAKQQMREEARGLLADARRLEALALKQILDTADVLCATLTSLDDELLGNRQFDLVVIDEACQCTEPACWTAIGRGEKLVLAGDHCQLPPTILSDAAAAQGFGVSLFERLMHAPGAEWSRLLNVQYRMHRTIMGFSSSEFYDEALTADAAVAEHRLYELPDVQLAPLTDAPLEFIDTAGASFDEELEPDGESRLNRGEAELAERKVRALLAAGLRPGEIAVIAPYAAQARLLRERLAVPGLEVDSVDGFQGREKEAVVISLVRSNREGEIGFLEDVRRMNVALTRARRKLLVIGDSATLATHPFYGRLLEYVELHGVYRTVWEEPQE